MDDLELRFLGPVDWQLWRSLRLVALAEAPEAFGATYEDELARPQAFWEGWLGKDEPQVALLDRGEPVAMGAGFLEDDDRLHVISMWTAPAYRGRRLAARVLDALVEWAAPRGLTLVLDVAIGNAGARSVYTAYGFTATGVTRPIRAGSPDLVEELVLRRG